MSKQEPIPEMVVHCGPCKHAWTAAYLPMEVSKLVRLIKGARCPKCGGNEIYMGGETAATSAESQGSLAFEFDIVSKNKTTERPDASRRGNKKVVRKSSGKKADAASPDGPAD